MRWLSLSLSRWFTLGLAIALLLVGCELAVSDRHGSNPSPSPAASSSPAPTIAPQAQVALSVPTGVPTVQGDRILRDIEALNFARYNPVDRDRARQYLINTLERDGWTVSTQALTGGANIIAKRPEQPNPTAKRLLIVAHYDTVDGSPGADDNASGVAVALEVARLLRDRPTPHALEITLFDLEERGLLGSLAFVANPANRRNILGVFNLEMVGFTCTTPNCQRYPEGLPITPPSDQGDFLAAVGDREHTYLLRALQILDAQPPPIIPLPIPFKGLFTPDILRSDHAPFWANNIGAVMLTDTADFRNPNYHQPTDTPETLDPQFLADVAQRVVTAAIALLESRSS